MVINQVSADQYHVTMARLDLLYLIYNYIVERGPPNATP